MTFPKPLRISAFAFKSANNYDHLDPSDITIKVKLVDESKRFKHYMHKDYDPASTKYIETHKISNLKFKYRSQIKYFLKLNPW